MTPELVVFDYSEVLSRNLPPAVRARIERAAGVDPEVFWAAFWGRRRPYNLGGSAAEFWAGVAADTGAGWDEAARQRLWALDIGGCLNPHPPTVRLARDLAARGVRLALLSDAPPDLAAALRVSPSMAVFERLFFSCDLGAVKPEDAAFERMLSALRADASRCLYVDDGAANVAAAARHGFVAHRYRGAGGLARFLAGHGLLPAS
ncbi:HAD-IA family hydrolase [Actinomadura flavalba]|uniref:HAD-IA family hydrolase n=1 Tax=Actinomadura flavalba TaxID=1120938 RepID=UPI00035FE029|nr:HAD-IA family hydrolase [Actinomadura flavalba]